MAASKARKARRAAEQAAKLAAKKAGIAIPTPSLPAEVNIVEDNQNQNNPPNNAPEAQDQSKVTKWKLAVTGISALTFFASLWAVTTNGFFGLFSDNPKIQLYPCGIASCVLLMVGADWMIRHFKFHKAWFVVSVAMSVVIGVFVVKVVRQKESDIQSAANERKQEHGIIMGLSNAPARFIEAEDARYSGELLPANEPNPLLEGRPVAVSPDGIYIFAGGGFFEANETGSTCLIMFGNEPVLSLSLEDGKASVSGKFFDSNTRFIAIFDKNKWDPN